jgi:hypothetical protein
VHCAPYFTDGCACRLVNNFGLASDFFDQVDDEPCSIGEESEGDQRKKSRDDENDVRDDLKHSHCSPPDIHWIALPLWQHICPFVQDLGYILCYVDAAQYMYGGGRMENCNWDEIGQEAIEHLQALLRFDTTNPPGNEMPCIQYLAETLRKAGYEPTVLESAPGRGNVVVRFKGTGEQAPFLIYGHVDVVTAEPEKWVHPPFAARVADGCLWGRGALDMKSIVAQELMTMLLLARAGQPLRRDVIFAATSDEEVGGHMGAGWLVDNHPELIRAEYALSEGAGATIHIGNQRFYGVRVAEKGTARFTLRAYGPPGHGSVPRPDTAIHAIAEAVDRLCEQPLPLHLTKTVSQYLRTIGQAVGVEVGVHITDETKHATSTHSPVIQPHRPSCRRERRSMSYLARLKQASMAVSFQDKRENPSSTRFVLSLATAMRSNR